MNNHENKSEIKVYEEEIKKFINSLSESLTVNELVVKVKELLSEIDNIKYFESKSIPYNLSHENNDDVYIELYEKDGENLSTIKILL